MTTPLQNPSQPIDGIFACLYKTYVGTDRSGPQIEEIWIPSTGIAYNETQGFFRLKKPRNGNQPFSAVLLPQDVIDELFAQVKENFLLTNVIPKLNPQNLT